MEGRLTGRAGIGGQEQMGDVGGAGALDRTTVEVVAKLMAKAQSTEYDTEAVALVERSYGLLARVLSDYDLAVDQRGGRRRERRLIRDRRKARRDRLYGDRPAASPVTSASDGTERYREVADAVRRQADGTEGRGTAVSL
jgi:hypothetical protein